MSDQLPEIQRYDPDLKYIGTSEYVAVFSRSEHGDAVMYEDHLLRLTLAKIAVLEEEDLHMVNFFEGTYNDENRMYRQEKIAALRKELGE